MLARRLATYGQAGFKPLNLNHRGLHVALLCGRRCTNQCFNSRQVVSSPHLRHSRIPLRARTPGGWKGSLLPLAGNPKPNTLDYFSAHSGPRLASGAPVKAYKQQARRFLLIYRSFQKHSAPTSSGQHVSGRDYYGTFIFRAYNAACR